MKLQITLISLFLALTSCKSLPVNTSAAIPLPDTTKEYTFKLHLVDDMNGYQGLHLLEKTTGVHHIWLLKKKYPYCLQHEIRHVLEGNFHAGRSSLDDCFQ